ncbi:MAG: 2-hydroxymuconate tautomerase family protein [Bacillota bacterium]|nr:2-hydroxymuconate tautomerase family protein [Bacillota bacterium]
MPIIEVHILEGRTVETKERLVREMTALVVDVLDSRPEAVRIIIDEMQPQNYAIAGESVSKRRATGKLKP